MQLCEEELSGNDLSPSNATNLLLMTHRLNLVEMKKVNNIIQKSNCPNLCYLVHLRHDNGRQGILPDARALQRGNEKASGPTYSVIGDRNA